MTGISTGMYMCGSILLTLALLGLIWKLAAIQTGPNQDVWAEINAKLLEAEADAEEEEANSE